MKHTYEELAKILSSAQTIVVLQADNPDGDSLGSSLALEAILSELDKQVYMVCAVDIPSYLHYLPGWDRVTKEIPRQFDATIVVDNSSETLFDNYAQKDSYAWIKTKPVVVIDHHTESPGLSYATVSINEEAVATGEVLHRIVVALNWPLPLDAAEMMAISIMSDSVGLVSDTTTASSIRVVADLVERGVSLAKLDDARRALMRKDPSLIPYKGQLLQRVKFDCDGQLAYVTIPWEEIERYSPLYNPTMLVLDDMRMVVNVQIAIGYKLYKDGRITAKIRTNYGITIAGELAAQFGGGGHEYAAGFKITDGTPFATIHERVAIEVNRLLAQT